MGELRSTGFARIKTGALPGHPVLAGSGSVGKVGVMAASQGSDHYLESSIISYLMDYAVDFSI